MQFDFPAVKLLDFAARWEALAASDNLFAVVVMAHLKTQETRGDNLGRYTWKMRLVRMLYERGVARADVRKLFHVIDWLMRLPKELEQAWWQEIHTFEEEQRMPYVTSVERIGIEKGLIKGREEGRASVLKALRQMLVLRFGTLPEELAEQLGELSLPQLNSLLDEAFSAPTLDEFMARVPTTTANN